MCREYQQILHGREVRGRLHPGTKLSKLSFPGDNYEFATHRTILLGGTLNIAPIRFLKLTGAWYIAVACFVLILTIFYLLQII